MSTPTTPETTMLPATRTAATPGEIVRLDMSTIQGFEALQRAGNMLSASSLVPETYRRWIIAKDGARIENPNGLANCVVAMNMANRMGADPLMVAQNLYVIEGRPSWSSAFIIASINQCGRFSPLRFDLTPQGDEVEASYKFTEWEEGANGKRRPTEKEGKMKIRHQACRAWAIEKATGQRLDGPEVSMQLALDEGWIQKKGSKWRTMPEVMLRYRAASLFGKLYAPELLMGLQSKDEIEDVIGEVIEVEPTPMKGQPAIKNISGSSWEIADTEAFDDLLDQIYTAFKDAGYAQEYKAFADFWRPKRGKGDPKGTLRDLQEEAKRFAAAVPKELELSQRDGEDS